jgi:polysaccharide deacetylase family protein (PEP-CTERM system associated)
MTGQMNILQIDVEDWYQDLDMHAWGQCEDRIVQSTNRVLEVLRQTSNHATFFMLGYIAERHPELVLSIKSQNHEVASHGYSHTSLIKQSPDDFEQDIMRSASVIQGITHVHLLGYRAPQFSVVKDTSWAIDILKKHGLKYDSSVFPVKTHLYGVPDAPLFPYRVSSADLTADAASEDFLEIPLSVYRVPVIGRNVPIAGGFYLRLLPYSLIKRGLGQINRLGKPAVCYLHPWELDPDQPKEASFPWYHYYRLSSTEGKFRRLLQDFRFTSVREYFGLDEVEV